MKTVYGYDVEPDGDRFVDLVDQAMISIRLGLANGTFLVDLLPILKNVPGNSFLPVETRFTSNQRGPKTGFLAPNSRNSRKDGGKMLKK